VIAACVSALPTDSDSWEESTHEIVALQVSQELESEANRLVAVSQFIQRIQSITPEECHAIVLRTHAHLTEAEAGPLAANLMKIMTGIVDWFVKHAKDAFDKTSAYLAALIHDKCVKGAAAITAALTAAKVKIHDNKKPIDLATQTLIQKAVTALKDELCNSMAEFLFWAAAYVNPAVKSAQEIAKGIDATGSAVKSLAGGYASVATAMKGVGINLPGTETAELVAATAAKVTIRDDIIKCIQGMIETAATKMFCASGEKLGKELAAYKGAWSAKPAAGKAMLFVENYVCTDERMSHCMKTNKIASKNWKEWDFAKGQLTCNFQSGPRIWWSMADAAAGLFDRGVKAVNRL